MNTRRLSTISLAAAVAICALTIGSAGASAATTYGETCDNPGAGPMTMFQTLSTGPTYTIAEDGVITSWTTNHIGLPGMTPVAAAVGTRSAGGWKIDAATPFQLVFGDQKTVFPARVSVRAGQVLGLLAPEYYGTMCAGFDATYDVVEYKSGGPGTALPGESIDSSQVSTIPTQRVNVSAVVEPDVDGDGFGDETQDKCPQSAAFIDPCPVLAISQQVSANSKQIKVLATASLSTSLTATAKVKVGRKTVTIKGKATKFTAGKLKTIKLNLPSSVKKARKALKKGKSLAATVTLTGKGIANTATTTKKLKLKR